LCLHTIFRALIYWAHRAVVLAIAWHLVFLSFRFFDSHTGRHSGPIFTIYTSNDAFSRKEVPFGGLDDEFSHFLPKIRKFALRPTATSNGNNSDIFKDRTKMFAPK